MNLRKIITVSASTLLLLSVGASANMYTVSNASASRVSRLEYRKSKDYRDIRSINAQLAKLKHHAKSSHKRNVRHHRTKRHESRAQYYKNHAKSWKRNKMINKAFRKGWNDAKWDNSNDDNAAVGQPEMNPNYRNNSNYKKGWVTSYIYNNNNSGDDFDGTAKAYGNVIHYFDNGVTYANQNNSTGNLTFNSNQNQWSPADN